MQEAKYHVHVLCCDLYIMHVSHLNISDNVHFKWTNLHMHCTAGQAYTIAQVESCQATCLSALMMQITASSIQYRSSTASSTQCKSSTASLDNMTTVHFTDADSNH